MSLATIATLAGLALIDSLNPVTVGQAAILSAGRRPVRSVLSFWAGALSAYLVLGALLILGPAQAIESLFTDPPDWLRSACVVIGPALALGGAALLRRATAPGAASRSGELAARLRRPRDGVAFFMGLATTALDAFTALPYFAAAAIVVAQDISFAGKLATLFAYNLVYLLPVLAVLGLRLALGARLDPAIDRALALLARFGGPLLATGALAGGVWLTVVGVQAMA